MSIADWHSGDIALADLPKKITACLQQAGANWSEKAGYVSAKAPDLPFMPIGLSIGELIKAEDWAEKIITPTGVIQQSDPAE